MSAIDFDKINKVALDRAKSLLSGLMPGGAFRGNEYIVRNPRRYDHNSGSFSINYGTGVWKDFSSGDGGNDLISLVAFVHGIGQGEAARELAEKLGIPLYKTNGARSSKTNGASDILPEAGAGDSAIVLPVSIDAPPVPTQHFGLGEPAEIWTYADATGAVIGHTCRFNLPEGKKEFWPLTLHRIDGELEWRWESWPPKRPLYGLHKLAQRPFANVVVAEGEKSADAAQKLFPDCVTVTSPNGSNAAYKADWSPLRGRDIVIWPDADAPGEKYKSDVIDCLIAGGVKSVATITPPVGVKEGWDAADALEEGWTTERVAQLVANAVAAPSLAQDGCPQGKPAVAVARAYEEIRRLASLAIVEYEFERTKVAESLGMRASVLDQLVTAARPSTENTKGQGRAFELPVIEPWPSEVTGAELLNEVTEAIKRYVVLPTNSAEALALWAMHTHCFDCFAYSPRAAITSPEKGCGKTTLLDVLERLVSRPLSTANATVSAIFRIVEQARPTLLIDEADTFLKENDELRGILNTGHRRGGQVLRTVGEDHEPRQFSTWAPAAIAMIGRLPDTLNDRSIIINLRRRKPTENAKSFRRDRAGDLNVLARKMARWAQDHQGQLTDSDPDMGELINRVADNWRPLFAIADVAGEHWPTKVRDIAVAADKTNTEQSVAVLLLQNIRWIFDGRPESEDGRTVLRGAATDRISSAGLVVQLIAMEESPWAEWNRGKEITQNGLARMLDRFGIRPGTIRLHTGQTAKGYYRSAFEDVFSRYLPPQTVTTSQPNNDGHFDDFGTVTTEKPVTVSKEQIPNNDGRCDGVTAATLPSGEEPILSTEQAEVGDLSSSTAETNHDHHEATAGEDSAAGNARKAGTRPVEGAAVSAVEALRIARAAAIELTVDGNNLLLAAASEPPLSIIEELRLRKPEIVELLQSEHDRFERRQHAAEPGPYREIIANLRSKCPDYVEPDRWQQAIRDADSFLGKWGAQAPALGWTARELFGLCPIPTNPRPFFDRLSRYDLTGLIWLLGSRPVVSMTADCAAIRTASGGAVVYRKYNKPALGPLGDSLDDMGTTT